MLRNLIGSFISNRWKFEWRYWRGNTPWDTQVTPPEVMELIANTSLGKALDLGCGTGTNAITLSRMISRSLREGEYPTPRSVS